MADYVTDTQALIKFMMGKRVINEQCHQAFLAADRGENIIIIPAVVLMEVLYLFEKNRIKIDLIETEGLLKSKNYQGGGLGISPQSSQRLLFLFFV